jgi:hypothetical protein
MNTRVKIFWLLSLAFFATGCSGYRVVHHSQPDLGADSAARDGISGDLKKGDLVRLRLTDGQEISGALYAVTPEGVELGVSDEFTKTEVIPVSTIESVAKKEIDGAATAITVLALFGSIALVAHAVQSSDLGFDMSDWDWGDGGIVY